MKKYTRLQLEDRIKIEVYHLLGWTIESIDRELERSKSSISRELSRSPGNYSAHIGLWYAVKKVAIVKLDAGLMIRMS
jgi:IS30 family transposase